MPVLNHRIVLHLIFSGRVKVPSREIHLKTAVKARFKGGHAGQQQDLPRGLVNSSLLEVLKSEGLRSGRLQLPQELWCCCSSTFSRLFADGHDGW